MPDNTAQDDAPQAEAAIHPIQVAARRTQLSADVIRAWERRYGAVIAKRSPTGRRLYSDADIDRLKLLNQAIHIGRRIGDVAHLPVQQLQTLIAEDQQTVSIVSSPAPVIDSHTDLPADRSATDSHLAACLQAIEQLRPDKLDMALHQAAVACSLPVLLEQLIFPLMHTVGERWQNGQLRLCHEHMASTTVRSFLGSLMQQSDFRQDSDFAPLIVITTLSGQLHELGAISAAIIAATKGWQTLYLGSSTPVEEIAFAASHRSARAVGLSLCYPADDPHLPLTLKKLRRHLPHDIAVLTGGFNLVSYQPVLNDINAICLNSMAELQQTLDRLRHPASTDRPDDN